MSQSTSGEIRAVSRDVLVRSASTSRPDFACEENQGCPDQAGASQNPEAIEKAEKSRLLLNDSRQFRLSVQSSIRGRKAVRREISRQRAEGFLIPRL